MSIKPNNKTNLSEVRFSVVSHAVWSNTIDSNIAVKSIPVMLRRRASTPGKIALETAYRCLGESGDNIPVIFCSRHGECERSVQLLSELAQHIPLSPTAFSLSVHNATGGLFSIARHDHVNSLAIAAGASTIEHAVIEACGLLADNAKAVLLVAYDSPLPEIFKSFQDCDEQLYAWAWLIQPVDNQADFIALSWSNINQHNIDLDNIKKKSSGIEIFQFYLNQASRLERNSNDTCWLWQWKSHESA